MAHSLGSPWGATVSRQQFSTSIFNILNIWSLSTTEIWPCYGKGGILLATNKWSGWPLLAELSKWPEVAGMKILISRTDLPSDRSVLYAPFLLISYMILPFFCAKRFHSLSTTHPECLTLSLMSLAKEWTWTCCHGVCSDTSLHHLLWKRKQKLLTSLLSALPPLYFQRTQSKKFNSWSSKYFPEETQFFLQHHPAYVWNLLYLNGERAPDLISTCNLQTYPSLWLLPARTQLAQPHLHLTMTC